MARTSIPCYSRGISTRWVIPIILLALISPSCRTKKADSEEEPRSVAVQNGGTWINIFPVGHQI
ncbi:MAG TPA: hypothetical protein VKF63_02710, partial [Terracidiphilus sp.]|nr:hypothetical protein [Terracidiphilus sp.]